VLQSVRHVPGLHRNLISLGALRGDGMLFWAEPDLKTMNIMKGDKTVMIGERTVSHLYKLQGCTVAGGVMEDGVAGVAVFSERGGFEVRSDSSGGSPGATKSTTQVWCTWSFAHDDFKLVNIRQGGVCWNCVEYCVLVGYVWT
jgi:hypothetical protein